MSTYLERHVRQRADGTKRIYNYAVDSTTGERRALGSTELGACSKTLYRQQTQKRLLATLQANASLLVVAEAGAGKTTLAESVVTELRAQGFIVSYGLPRTLKQTLLNMAGDIGVEDTDLEGKKLTTAGLMDAIAAWLQDNLAFLIVDDAHKFTPQFRYWLEDLHKQNQPLLLLATYPPAKDIFLRLPRIELKPLTNPQIRGVMLEAAEELGLELNDGQIAALAQRCAGNPMLARRVVREEYLGLEDLAPDHTQWLDLTPFLVAVMLCAVLVRFLGLGFNSTTLYLIGGILTVAVGVVRVLLASMPRQKGRLGK
jgi:hypothetical protein